MKATKTVNPATVGKLRLTTSAMIASIAGEGQRTKPAPFGNTLVELARERHDIVGMTADLGKYTDLHIFAKEFPDRYYQMGMAEQLLFGAASGIAAEGYPVRHDLCRLLSSSRLRLHPPDDRGRGS
jgi:transketolase